VDDQAAAARLLGEDIANVIGDALARGLPSVGRDPEEIDFSTR
jgi:hypothetical protein